jgi:hypothetical protein
MDLNLAGNLLNFIFETSNAISYQILALYALEKIVANVLESPVWKASPNSKKEPAGTLKMVQPAPLSAINLEAPVEMLLIFLNFMSLGGMYRSEVPTAIGWSFCKVAAASSSRFER